MNHSELLKGFYRDVWVNRDLDAIDRYFAPDAKADGVISHMQFAPGDFRDLVMAVSQLLGPLKIDFPVLIESGDWVSTVLQVRSTRADNGAPVNVSGQSMVRFRDGKMVEAYNQFDFVSLFEQLGQVPQDTLPVCLTGARLD